MSSLFQNVLKLHQKVYIGTGGRLGHRLLFGNPTLLLTTTGRRTGLPRTVALTYATDGPDYLVVASNGGAARPPAWLGNLEATPSCEVQIGTRRSAAQASVVMPGDPRFDAYWAAVNKVNRDRYTEYQRATSRQIPVVALRPADA